MGVVDTKYMIFKGKSRLFIGVSLFALATVIFANEKTIQRQAVKPPAKTLASMNQIHEGHEIDEEIDKYFQGRIGKSDIDEKELSLFFGENIEVLEQEEKGTISLANRGRLGYMSSYRIRAGDTIYGIAKRTRLTPALILKHNPELRKRPLYIGEEIIIVKKKVASRISRPTRRYIIIHKIKKNEYLSHVARKYHVSLKHIYKWNRLNSKSIIRCGQKIKIIRKSKRAPAGYKYVSSFMWPVRGVITSRYGRRRNPFTKHRQYHKGIDIGIKIGSKFIASRDGVVILSARMGGYGNCIFIRHVNGYVSVYGHNKKNLVKIGDVVKRGQVIGEVGRTGSATGPHLHFEIRKWKRPVNPMVAFTYKELAPRKVAKR